MNLYNQFAKDFSSTRQYPWKGWSNLVPYFKNFNSLEILDLGCGNGRLLKQVEGLGLKVEGYLGVDSSNEMIDIANKQFENSELDLNFKVLDLEEDVWDLGINKEFNIICGFGLIHHIKKLDIRLMILEKSKNLLQNEGYLIFSFWQFVNFPEFLEKHVIKDLSNNDYILSFGGKDSGAERFCHSFSNEEIDEIENRLSLKRVDSFLSDGVENKMNKYLVWQLA